MKSDSPCTDVCQYDHRKKRCICCGRTTDEIKWFRKPSLFQTT